MIATFKADFYRLFKTKGFWLSQLFIIGFIFISIASQSVGQVGVNLEESTQETAAQYAMKWTGIISVQAVTSMMTMFFYAMLPMLVIIIGHDFSKKTYKNILTVGVSRTKYFLSQYISFAIMIFLQVIYIYLASFLTGTLFYGVGSGFNQKQLLNWLMTASVQFIMIMAILTISCFVTYLTKNNVLSILTAIILPIILTLLGFMFKNAEWVSLFDFQNTLGDTEFILSRSNELYQSILVALSTILVFLMLTIYQFNKSEL
ncbi:ABC transporter permease [Vagococcus sp. JNUCC 83]